MDMVAAHAVWSTDARKRWVTVARRQGGRWLAEAPVPVGPPAAMLAGLLASGAPVALGLDLPLGLPREYASALAEADFPSFLRGLVARPGFFQVSPGLETVAPGQPFYPARGVKGMTRAAHAAALGLSGPAGLSRWCDRATATRPAGAPVFWTLGANQSGKAAISAWRDWLAPALAAEATACTLAAEAAAHNCAAEAAAHNCAAEASGTAAGARLRLWPFHGALHALLAPGVAVLAEVYPAEAMRHCGVKLAGSKRAQAPRQAAAPALLAAMALRGVVPSPALAAMLAAGFGADAQGEDRFDSLVGLLGLVGVLEGLRPDFVPADPWVRRWEGWVLGQTDLPGAR